MTNHGLNYSNQDRGNTEKYQKYLSGMDSVIVEKIASASAYIPHKPGYSIIDVGTASGTGSYILAMLFPLCKVIGMDINPRMIEIAKSKYKLPNLEYLVDDGEKLNKLKEEKIIGFFNCSSIHHITSFNNYNPTRAFNTIKRQSELLQTGGVIVIRDFVKPEPKQIILEFIGEKTAIKNSNLLLKFSTTARSLSPMDELGFPIEKINEKSFKLNYCDALEFVRRKDYLDDWNVELKEEYAYYSQIEFENIFSNLGLRTIISSPIYNPWIIKNRYKNQFHIFDLDGNKLGTPPTNYVIAGEKCKNKGVKLKSIRELPILENSFLKINSYKNRITNEVYDVAQRPNPVIDILPFYFNENGNIIIIAKHGYPRPIITELNQVEVIDNKNYSGYVIESITAIKANHDNETLIKEALNKQTNIKKDEILKIHKSLIYYPSPGGIDEKVESYLVEIKPSINTKSYVNKNGLDENGEIRHYDAVQLLKSIQVGAIPDVRLEISIYNLLEKFQAPKEKWLNNFIKARSVENIKISKFDLIEIGNKEQHFIYTEKNSGFLKHLRTKFYEINRQQSTIILEYIIPQNLSSNTVITLPIFLFKNEILLGLEQRFLPVPQIHDNNSILLAAPAFRIPKNISNYNNLHSFIKSKKIGDSTINHYTKLGEKYLPCTGLTPEQVYPYIVTLNHPTDELFWVSLNELMKNRARIRDAHLLACIFRLYHAIQN